MALAYTYNTLTAALLDYMEQEGEEKYAGQINAIIQMAEAGIAREVDTPDQQAMVPGTFGPVNHGSIQAPLDFISPIALLVQSNPTSSFTPLLLKNETFIYEAYGVGVQGESPSSTLGRPKYYAIQGTNFGIQDAPIIKGATIILGPPSDQAYPYQLSYRKQPDSIVTEAKSTYSTWVAFYYPQTLLYACICEIGNFVKLATGDTMPLQAQYEKWFIAGLSQMRRGMAENANDEFRKADPQPQPVAAGGQ